MNLTPQQQQELWDFMQALKSSSTIPYEVDGAFRNRFATSLGLVVSSKGADTEDVTVNESGSSTYTVMDDPDGFLEVNINGTVYYLPYFS